VGGLGAERKKRGNRNQEREIRKEKSGNRNQEMGERKEVAPVKYASLVMVMNFTG